MKRIGLHFPPPFKRLLYALIAGSWLSGTAWFVLHRWFFVEGEFGERHSAWEAVLLKIHGGLAMLAMIFFGYLLATHVTVALRTRRNRILGFSVLGGVSFQIITGYGLFYFGDEQLRAVTSWAHLASGVFLPAVLALHIWTGHRRSRAELRIR